MEYVKVSKQDGIATVMLCKGKVHELSEPAVDQIHNCLKDLEKENDVRAIVLIGEGKFFSFGLDIPGFLNYRKTDFARFLTKFTDLYKYLFIYPKPILAAINGHAIAGGCMVATACDYRIMISNNAKISLNEITFGASVFAGSMVMLKFLVGGRNAEKIVLSGKMFNANEAMELGLVDQVSAEEQFIADVRAKAAELTGYDTVAYGHIKGLLRKPLASLMTAREKESIAEFNEIWYSESTWKQLQEIKIK
jgi:enoyl-CoA hydratase/carnithine racemase